MRTIQLAAVPALAAALVLAGAAVAQSPDRRDEVRVPFASPISVDDIVARVLSFDKDKKGKVTKNDLPERMQFLIDLGDTNKDGALDPEEIRALAARQRGVPSGGFVRGRVRVGPELGSGPGASAGFNSGPGASAGFNVAVRGDTNAIEGAVEDLRLSGGKKDRAMAAVKAHQENIRKLMDRARAELLQKMVAILSEEELNDFKAAMDRPRGGVTIVAPPADAPRDGRR
jgi:hypothetical protein